MMRDQDYEAIKMKPRSYPKDEASEAAKLAIETVAAIIEPVLQDIRDRLMASLSRCESVTEDCERDREGEAMARTTFSPDLLARRDADTYIAITEAFDRLKKSVIHQLRNSDGPASLVVEVDIKVESPRLIGRG